MAKSSDTYKAFVFLHRLLFAVAVGLGVYIWIERFDSLIWYGLGWWLGLGLAAAHSCMEDNRGS